MTDDQAALREAMEWLDKVPVSIWWDNHAQEEYRATLKRRLAMPVLPDVKLWLWKNGDHYLAFMHEYPCESLGGDPLTLGEPAAVALLRPSFPRFPEVNLTKPKTKIVWRVSWGDGRSYDDHFTFNSAIDWLRRHPPAMATTITPVEVPA